jgi:putative effector of murein hydrolase LrgA (UPF0299 family)
MIVALTLLLTCQLVGEALARLLALPVPGPVIGLVLLFLGLRWRPSAALDGAPLATVAGVLLAYGPGLLTALVLSTALTLAVTAFVFVKVAALVGSRPDPTP